MLEAQDETVQRHKIAELFKFSDLMLQKTAIPLRVHA